MKKETLENPQYGKLENGKPIIHDKLLHSHSRYVSARYSDTDITFIFPKEINRQDWEGFCKELKELSKELLKEKIEHPTLAVEIELDETVEHERNE